MADPEWAEFEQLNLKTIIRPRGDFVFRFGQDFEEGLRSKVGEIVYNPADGLVYRCTQETSSIAPDYTDANANLYWTWISGTVSGFVTNRGWWWKSADGVLIQRSVSLAKTAAAGSVNWTFPLEFFEKTLDIALTAVSFGAQHFGVYVYDTATTTSLAAIYFSATANAHLITAVAHGRWKA